MEQQTKRIMTINSACVDTINMLLFRREELIALPNKTKQVRKDLNCLSKDELINILNTYENYHFEDNHIIYQRPLTEVEISVEESNINGGIKYDIHKLKKWCDTSDQTKEQILNYISRHNIEIKEIK